MKAITIAITLAAVLSLAACDKREAPAQDHTSMAGVPKCRVDPLNTKTHECEKN